MTHFRIRAKAACSVKRARSEAKKIAAFLRKYPEDESAGIKNERLKYFRHVILLDSWKRSRGREPALA